MKICMQISVALVLVLSLVLGLLPVSAAQYTWTDGQVPEDWLDGYVTSADEITATNLLAPVNPNASQEAKNLQAYLSTLTDSQNFLIGQFDIAGDDVTYQSIKQEFGLEPALYSCHYQVNVTEPVFEVGPNGEETVNILNDTLTISEEEIAKKSKLLIDHYNNGNILLVHTDSAPREVCSELAIKKELYDSEANCIIELDACNPDRDMQIYALWMRYQKNVLAVLKNLEANGVNAYLWRPWIEFNYHQFSGTSEEGYIAFTRVFQQTVQMAIDAGLKGFLVTYSPGCWGNTLNRNPGNNYVDVYAATMYSETDELGHLHANQYSNYSWYVKTGKPIGFAEFACRDGDEARLQARGSWYAMLEDLTTYWPNASWMNIWGGVHYSLTNDDGGSNGNDDGGLFIDNPFTLHLAEMADYQTGVIKAPGIAQLFTDLKTYQGMEERSYSAAELKKLGLDLKDLCAIRLNTGYSITFYAEDDCTGESWGYASSVTALDPAVAAQFKSCTIAATANAALEKAGIYASHNDAQAWKANDGASSAWTADVDGEAWLMIDLEVPHTVNRYVLKNAGFAGDQTMYNTRDFQIQYSLDGENWVTVDTVTDNVASQVDRNIQAITARYFRLLITGANSCTIPGEEGIVTVAEFELYGLPAGGQSSDDTVMDPDDEPGTDSSNDADEPEDTDEPVDNDEPEDTDDEDDSTGKKKVQKVTYVTYFPWWAWVLIAAGVLLVGGGVLLLILLRRRKKAQAQEPPAET